MNVQSNSWSKKNIWSLSTFLRTRFLRICPYGKSYLNELIWDCRKDILKLSILSVVVIVLWNSLFDSVSLVYLVECIIFGVYLVGMEVSNHKLQKRENRVYQELLIFFSRVKHRYISHHHIANAVLDAAENMSYEIERLAGELYRVLMECDRKERVREYILFNRTNRYLKLFLVQAYEASEKGETCFLDNIEFLRMELMEEIYHRKRKMYDFAGYVFVAVTPFFMMPILKQWGLEFAPALDFFYAGTGALLESITFLLTLLIYRLILEVKEVSLYEVSGVKKAWNTEFLYNNEEVNRFIQKLDQTQGRFSESIRQLILLSGKRMNYGRLCFKMIVMAVCTFFALSMFFAETHSKERKIVLESVETIDTIAPIASEEKKKILAEHILTVVHHYRNHPDTKEEEIRSCLRERIRVGNENMEWAAVQEIKNKLLQYNSAKGSWLELLLCVAGGMFGGLIPLLKLKFYAGIIRAGAVYEMRQFQSILLMERRLQGITILGLLEDMEVFSICFKNVLRRCINAYGTGPRAALLKLKEEGNQIYEGFDELADAFLSIDEVGIELAFAEVENNRRLLDKMTQLKAEISMERKKDGTDILAKIPMILAVGVYFVLPFFWYSLQGVYEVFDLLEGMQR